MKEKAKIIIKKMLGQVTHYDHSTYNVDKYPESLKQLVKDHDNMLEERPILGKRKDGKDFYPPIAIMEKSYNFFNNDVYKYGKDNIKTISEYDGLQSGTPLKCKPFKPCIKEMRKELKSDKLYWYPGTMGNIANRQKFVNYLKREGFINIGKENGLGVENIVFTCSTTHGYRLILNTIAHNEDVILITAPNYGLFATVTELTSAHVETVNIYEEDDWFVNPSVLSKRIDEENKKLKEKYKNSNLRYTPKVVAFLNMNPHNPLGKVMNHKNIQILEGIADVCLEKNVLIIDDLIYRDLTYDMDDLALPIASIPKYFNNTISLMGISKAFGLASIRAGVLIAPTPIAKAISDEIEHDILSYPTLQGAAITGAFNDSDKRYKDVKKYLTPIINEYQFRFQLLKAMVEGINNVESKYHNRIKKELNYYIQDSNKVNELLNGIKDVYIRKGTTPESGFFAVLDFTKLKGKKYDNETITTDIDLLKYFYSKAKIKFIMGSNISWPYEDEIVGRVTFSLDIRALISNMKLINECVKELHD